MTQRIDSRSGGENEASPQVRPLIGRPVLSRLAQPWGDPSSDGWTRLNTNELAIGPSPEVRRAILSASAHPNRYPHPLGEPLRSKLAEFHGVSVDNVIVTAGADGALSLCFRAFCDPGAGVALLDPTYPFLGNLAQLASAKIVTAPAVDDLVTGSGPHNVSLIVIVNPNSPTGRWVPADRLVPSDSFKGVIVIDEAYAPFARESALDAFRNRRNWLIVRTFSKAYGLAALRVGYAIGDEHVIARLRLVQDPYPVNSHGIDAAMAALSDSAHYEKCIDVVCAERERLSLALQSMGWAVPRSAANFVLGRPPSGISSSFIADRLYREKILVRRFPAIAGSIRISVGSSDEIDLLINRLRRITEEHGS